jgi:hypothetical protein
LGTKADQMVVKEISYDISSPTIDSQILLLRAAGADVVLLAAIPKFAAQGLNPRSSAGNLFTSYPHRPRPSSSRWKRSAA